MGTIQDLQFSWKDHKDFLTKSFKQQRDSEQHCNVSVVSSDGFVVRSHQAVLASASGWFARELLRHCHDHPTIVLHDVPLGHLKAILNYIYFGAVQIEQSMMTELLEIADNLELKGLCRIRKNSAINKFLSVGSAGVVGKAEQDSFVGASSSQTRPLAGGGLARSAAVDGRVSRPSPVFTSQLQYNQEDRHYPHHHHTLLQSHDAACVGGGSGGEPVLFGDPCEDSQPAEENAEEEQLQSSNHAQSSKMSSSSIQHDTENSCGRSALASSQMPGQHHYLGLARLNEPPSVSGSTSTSTLQHQGSFMSCSSMNNGVVHSVSSNNAPSTIDISSSQHSNGLSYVPSSSASCYNQPSTSLSSIFHNRSVAATSCSSSIQQQQQQQQHLVQFTSNNLQTTHHPSSQLITTSTTVNPFTTKREFDAKMLTRSVTGPLDYHCANQQLQEQEQQQHHHHSVEDFRAQHSSNKMNQASKVSNEGGSQEIAYLPQDSHVIEQLHQHSVAAAAALNTQQQCLQQQGQQLPQRHLYSQYVHGVGGQVSFVSAAQGCGNSNIISSSSSATGSHLQSMQQQQQQQQQQQSHQAQQLQQLHLQHQQQTSSFGFECSLASTGSSVTFKSGSSIGNGGVVGAYQSIPGNQHNSQDEAMVSGGSDGLVLRASTSNSTGYQTAGIDLSLTKSEPPSPRDYTAAAGVFAPTNKRKRAGAAEYNSRREDESDGEEVAGPQHLYEEEKEGVETDLDEVGDRSHHKRNKLTTHHNQRGGAAEGSGGQGPRPASPSLQPEAGGQSTAVDMMTDVKQDTPVRNDWDDPQPTASNSSAPSQTQASDAKLLSGDGKLSHAPLSDVSALKLASSSSSEEHSTATAVESACKGFPGYVPTSRSLEFPAPAATSCSKSSSEPSSMSSVINNTSSTPLSLSSSSSLCSLSIASDLLVTATSSSSSRAGGNLGHTSVTLCHTPSSVLTLPSTISSIPSSLACSLTSTVESLLHCLPSRPIVASVNDPSVLPLRISVTVKPRCSSGQSIRQQTTLASEVTDQWEDSTGSRLLSFGGRALVTGHRIEGDGPPSCPDLSMDDINSSNSNDVDILSGGGDCLVGEEVQGEKESSTVKRCRFSIDQLATTMTSVVQAAEGDRLESESNPVGHVSNFRDVELVGPDGPVLISVITDQVKDVPCAHRKLDFCLMKDVYETSEHHEQDLKTGVSTGDNPLKPLKSAKNESSSTPAELNVKMDHFPKLEASSSRLTANLGISNHHSYNPRSRADGPDDDDDSSSSDRGSGNDYNPQKSKLFFSEQRSGPKICNTRLKVSRRFKRKAKNKRLEERRRWLAREKKVLFSGLEKRPVTRALDQLRNISVKREELDDQALNSLEVDCDNLNVDTVDCVNVNVSDVDCSDVRVDNVDCHNGKNIDVGSHSENVNVTCDVPFHESVSENIDKENLSICIDDGILDVSEMSGTATISNNVSDVVDRCHNQNGFAKSARRIARCISPMALFTLPPIKEKEKQTRISLTLQAKVKVIEAFLDGKSQRQIAQLHGIGKTQVSGIIKRREEILAVYRNNLVRGDKLTIKRQRKSEYALLNEHLIKWYRHMATGTKITTGMLRAKALQIAPQLGYHDFKASNGWLATFKGNNNLKFSRASSNNHSNNNNNAHSGSNSGTNNIGNKSLHHRITGDGAESPPQRGGDEHHALADEGSYFEEADVETNTTEEEEAHHHHHHHHHHHQLLGTGHDGTGGGILEGGAVAGSVSSVTAASLAIRGGGGGGDSLNGGGSIGLGGGGGGGVGGPCAGGFLASPGLLQGAAAAAILKCGVSVAAAGGQTAAVTAANLAPQLPMEAFHLSRTAAAAMDSHNTAAHNHPHHHHHHPAGAGPSTLALAAAGKGDQSSAAAAAAAAAGVLGYKSEEPPLGYGGYDHHHHHHQLPARMAAAADQLPHRMSDQLSGRMAADQLAPPQLGGRGMTSDQLTGRLGEVTGASSSAVASSSAAAAAVAAAARTSEYNYAPYSFPSGYYGYHFLGQY